MFVISWVNPDERLAQKSFEDYMLEGPSRRLDAIDAATGERSVNTPSAICLGGTLLASTLGYLTVARRRSYRKRDLFRDASSTSAT